MAAIQRLLGGANFVAVAGNASPDMSKRIRREVVCADSETMTLCVRPTFTGNVIGYVPVPLPDSFS